MKHQRPVKSFDIVPGRGDIIPETGSNDVRFEATAIMWDKKIAPVIGRHAVEMSLTLPTVTTRVKSWTGARPSVQPPAQATFQFPQPVPGELTA